MPPNLSDWGQLFYMQQHNMPTRLLDWTSSLGRALYFALRAPGPSPVVWVLNPYQLNAMVGDRGVSTLHRRAKIDYSALLKAGFPPGHFAAAGDSVIERLRHQQGHFTCAGRDLGQPLEVYCPSAATPFLLPHAALDDARAYLALFGYDEFTTFPDLDGLSRSIRFEELGLAIS